MNIIRSVVRNWKQYWGNMKKKVLNEAGLTLIELMVVVVILGIISAIAIPSISNAINSAKQNTTIATLSTIQTALQQYYTDHDAYPTELAQLTNKTDANGLADSAGVYGPYLDGPTSGTTIEKDAWGTAISYYTPTGPYTSGTATTYSSTGYVLASNGNGGSVIKIDTAIPANDIYCAGGTGTGATSTTPVLLSAASSFTLTNAGAVTTD